MLNINNKNMDTYYYLSIDKQSSSNKMSKNSKNYTIDSCVKIKVALFFAI